MTTGNGYSGWVLQTRDGETHFYVRGAPMSHKIEFVPGEPTAVLMIEHTQQVSILLPRGVKLSYKEEHVVGFVSEGTSNSQINGGVLFIDFPEGSEYFVSIADDYPNRIEISFLKEGTPLLSLKRVRVETRAGLRPQISVEGWEN